MALEKMAVKGGRRRFLQSIAVTAAFPGTACSDKRGSSPAADNSGQVSTSGPGPTTPAIGETHASATTTTGTEGAPTTEQAPATSTGDNEQTNAMTSGESTVSNSRPSGPLGVALLGLGRYAGERLAPALQLTQHCRLVGIVTGTPSKVAEWQTRYGIEDKNVYSYETMAELIDNPDIDVVYVVTPNHVHPTFVIAAARAKKHVWCEKPLAMTPAECQSMIDACNENGVTLAVGYRLQHEPNTQTLIGYADSKPFGAITQVEALAGFSGFGANDADVWRLKKEPGGGALFDMGVYCINAARYSLGEEPSRVRSATQWTNRPELFTEVDEYTDFELEFPSGAVALCRTSFGERMDFLEVTCEQGNYKLEPFQAYTGVSGGASDGVQFNQPIDNQQAKQMDDNALAIIEGRPLLVPGEEGLRDVRIVQAIVQSAQTAQPVDLG
jgi:glucose-fructose oxidoreductase